MSGDDSLIPRIYSLCSAVQVYLTSFIYPPLIMFCIILLYLLCTMFNFDEISRAIPRYMNFHNPQNTVHNTVEIHLSERWLYG